MSSLIHKLKTTHPDIAFVQGEEFLWSPSNRTIFYNPEAPQASLLLLHEFSHSVLDHHTYNRDVELIALITILTTETLSLSPWNQPPGNTPLLLPRNTLYGSMMMSFKII